MIVDKTFNKIQIFEPSRFSLILIFLSKDIHCNIYILHPIQKHNVNSSFKFAFRNLFSTLNCFAFPINEPLEIT